MDIKKEFLYSFTNFLKKESTRSGAAILADTADTASIIKNFQKRENMFIFY